MFILTSLNIAAYVIFFGYIIRRVGQKLQGYTRQIIIIFLILQLVGWIANIITIVFDRTYNWYHKFKRTFI